MKQFNFLIFILMYSLTVQAQLKTGLTEIRDTSYNVQNEYRKHIKNYPQLKIAEGFSYPSVKEEKDIVYSTLNKRQLKIDVFSPSAKKTALKTAIIFIHGGGWRSGDKSMHHPLMQELAAIGYVCFTPEYRLSTEALYPAAVYDVKSAIRWVRKNAAKYHVDPNKIVISGHSAGGELAAFMGATNGMKEYEGNGCYKEISSKVNAVIDLDGTLSFYLPADAVPDESKGPSAATYWFGYKKTENIELWKQASPLQHVGKHTPPFQFINSSVERMHNGRDEFIAVLNRAHIYSEVNTLEGSPHTFLLFHPWFDTTVVYMDRFLKKIFPSTQTITKKIIVSQNGDGDFTTVQQAINAIPVNNTSPIIIFIKRGIYKEKILVDSAKQFITLIGEDKLNTVLTYNDHTGKISTTGDTISTRTSWSFKILAANFTAKDLTIQNDAGFNAGQAVALESDGDKATFINCRFIGFQDVLFTNNEKSRQYYEHCYIEGTTDFIFGSSTAWFENCFIYCKKNSYITAASTPKENRYGYVFHQCRIEGDTSLHNVSLGRPWRPFASVTYLNCYIGTIIKPEGWSNWNKTENYKTTRYAEFNNYGPSSDPSKRIEWAKMLTAEEAKKFTLQNVLRGWKPVKE